MPCTSSSVPKIIENTAYSEQSESERRYSFAFSQSMCQLGIAMAFSGDAEINGHG